jgi:hypothetical protein
VLGDHRVQIAVAVGEHEPFPVVNRLRLPWLGVQAYLERGVRQALVRSGGVTGRERNYVVARRRFFV